MTKEERDYLKLCIDIVAPHCFWRFSETKDGRLSIRFGQQNSRPLAFIPENPTYRDTMNALLTILVGSKAQYTHEQIEELVQALFSIVGRVDNFRKNKVIT